MHLSSVLRAAGVLTRRAVLQLALAFALLFVLAPREAFAEVKVATVDFQRAINEVAEGKRAKANLEKMHADKKGSIDKLGVKVQSMQTDYEKQALLMSDDARKAAEEQLYMASMQYQQAAAQAEGEFQQAYMQAMESLLTKMRTIAAKIGTERGYTLVLEVTEGGVIYSVPSIDITDELIKRYNEQNPAK